jgi:hypothetical protein
MRFGVTAMRPRLRFVDVKCASSLEKPGGASPVCSKKAVRQTAWRDRPGNAPLEQEAGVARSPVSRRLDFHAFRESVGGDSSLKSQHAVVYLGSDLVGLDSLGQVNRPEEIP